VLDFAIALALASTPLGDYQDARRHLETRRLELAASLRRAPSRARIEARDALLAYFETSAFPAWEGTKWNFYGTSTMPREGTIACGYYVTTVLEQAGFRIQRVRLAQQASAVVVSTMARGTKVEWLRPEGNAEAVAMIRDRFGDGLYVVGFDFHVGFLRLEGDRAAFCHSSWIEPGAVTCEDPVASAAFGSTLYVVGDVLNELVLDDWLLGRSIPLKRR
jgi:hypothetical protein